MTLFFSIVLIGVVAAFVAAPFFWRDAVVTPPAGPERSDRHRLERQKFEAYAAIKESEFDYRMGKLSDADFAAVRAQYSAQALAALAALDSAPPHGQESRRPARIKYCPSCGQAVPPRASFCPACGRSLKEAVA